MAIRPPNKGPDGGFRLDLSTPDSRAREAEKEAQRRITEAARQTAEAQRQSSQSLDDIKDEYVKRSSVESARQEASIEAQKQKYYEQLRELKRAQDKELKRVRQEGERDLGTLKDYYRHSIYETERDGSRSLEQTKGSLARNIEHTLKLGQADREAVEAESQRSLAAIRDEKQLAIIAERDRAQADYEKIRGHTAAATEKAREQFEKRYQESVDKQNKLVNEVNSRAVRQIRDLKSDTSRKLDAYATRQRDPFYQLVDLDADLSETSDAFILTAYIPEHEQRHVSVTVRGNQIVLSGSRRNQERLDEAPGKTVQTASFQSYSETFPIDWPVNAKGLLREFDGDRMTVTIPKKKAYMETPMHQAPPSERAAAPRPQFPVNIPLGPKPETDPEAEGTPQA